MNIAIFQRSMLDWRTRSQEIADYLISGRAGSVWSPDTLFVAIRAGFRCEYCGANLLESVDAYDSMELDHIIPKSSRDPKDPVVHCLDNLALACRTCNKYKRAFLPGAPESTRPELITAARQCIDARRTRKTREIQKVQLLADELAAIYAQHSATPAKHETDAVRKPDADQP